MSEATEKITAYRDDLAYIHDAGYGGFAREAASVLVDALGRARISVGLVVDLGCGSGILSAVVGGFGYRTLGIDISEGMIALARKHVPDGEFRVESVLSASLPRCVAVAAVGECLNYLFDPANTKPKLIKLYRRIHTALEPGGFLIMDVAEPGRASGRVPARTYREGKDWAVLVTNEEDRVRRILTKRITSFRRCGDLYRRDHEVHQQRLIEGGEVISQLREIGFRVRALAGYGPIKFGRGQTGFIARKP